ncbi:hypothetical protein ACFCVO_19545 [Agromyces sp. NPDC056379]|uniref:hypothetical protein n=1 Tax=unclassified Agromyces TaxID=2639701 RepID=UPI0035E29C79
MDSVASLEKLITRFADATDPGSAVASAFAAAVEELGEKVRRFDPFRLIEVARLAYLPFGPGGMAAASAQAIPAQIELIALLALTSASKPYEDGGVEPQEMSEFVSEAPPALMDLAQLAQLRGTFTVDSNDKLALISLLLRGSEVWVRNTSYRELVSETNIDLLDGHTKVRQAMRASLGFDAGQALAVLDACHELQMQSLNDRMSRMQDAFTESASGSSPSPQEIADAGAAFMNVFEPRSESSTVSVIDIAGKSGMPEQTVHAVIQRFRLDLGDLSTADAVDAFFTGNNPLRSRPVIVAPSGRVLLPHDVLTPFAVRENLEEFLKTTSVWDMYAKHRGDRLEARTRRALDRVLPGATYRDAFLYYVPANSAEETAGQPEKYTKRAEADHLVVLGDVAIIVEDKAVAFSPLARGGKATRLRSDLTGIITKAAQQAGRLRDCIERDGGLRIEDEGWVDLSHIREIHTIAVSLDDVSILTATAHLVDAGLLDLDNIPWTVSLHDLDLITQLVDRPAEFLLYLRRRREPDATVMFAAPDELDLFLYFLRDGLWIEPDPALVRTSFPFLPAPTPGELRRYRGRRPGFILSQTDALDAWFYTRRREPLRDAPAPKPAMAPSMLHPLIDELQMRNSPNWLSIGATLLSVAGGTQEQFARNADDLLDNPLPGRGRRLAVPMPTVDQASAWLMVWATHPPGTDLAHEASNLRDYIRAKKHQLGIPRAAVLLYDEKTRELIDVIYDGHLGEPDAAATALMSYLKPATALTRRLHPNAKRPRTPIG